MAEALQHPTLGYYARGTAFGAAGDFTTAPEVSQMFGELVGLWCADLWQRAGRPSPCALVELGPGRGTLMADLLRATRRIDGFHAAMTLHLVETSPALRAQQRRALGGRAARWHGRLEEVPEGPALLVANEFLDALPVRQLVRRQGRWHERVIGLKDGRLAFGLSALPLPGGPAEAPEGVLLEVSPAREAVAAELGRRIAGHGLAALLVDYGFAGPAFGDTLQAVRRHAYHPVLEAPGEADLTAHVDFTALAERARAAGAAALGPIPQGDFLQRLGIAQRAAALRRAASAAQAAELDAALARLTRPEGMGRLFRVLAIAHPDLPQPAGFSP